MMSMPLTALPNWRSLLFVPVTREKFVATAHSAAPTPSSLILRTACRKKASSAAASSFRPRPARSAKLAPKFWFGSIDPGIMLSATSRPR